MEQAERQRVLDLVQRLKAEVEAAGVPVYLEEVDEVECRDGTSCSGFFEDVPELVMKVAVGKDLDDWCHIFLHEYNHFCQWREGIPMWADSIIDGTECLDLVMDDFEGKITLGREVVEQYLHLQAIVERDCEIRTLRMIREHDLPIDQVWYAKASNAYVAFYYAMGELRSWCNTKAPTQIDEIMEQMPTETEGVDHRKLGLSLVDLFREHCI